MECKGSRDILDQIVATWKSGLSITGLLQKADFYLNSTFIFNGATTKIPMRIEIDKTMNDAEVEFRANGEIVAKIINIGEK